MSFLKITKLLADGDTESNPGQAYRVLKTVSGSIHQGRPKFGLTAGVQCSCNALFAICGPTVRKHQYRNLWIWTLYLIMLISCKSK